jgi:hypothetical protein
MTLGAVSDAQLLRPGSLLRPAAWTPRPSPPGSRWHYSQASGWALICAFRSLKTEAHRVGVRRGASCSIRRVIAEHLESEITKIPRFHSWQVCAVTPKEPWRRTKTRRMCYMAPRSLLLQSGSDRQSRSSS